MEEFISRCYYQAGQYDQLESYAELDKSLKALEVPASRTALQPPSLPPLTS